MQLFLATIIVASFIFAVCFACQYENNAIREAKKKMRSQHKPALDDDQILELINAIVAKRYNNYQGQAFWELRAQHQRILNNSGPAAFLDYLVELERVNPRPVYKSSLSDKPVNIN